MALENHACLDSTATAVCHGHKYKPAPPPIFYNLVALNCSNHRVLPTTVRNERCASITRKSTPVEIIHGRTSPIIATMSIGQEKSAG